MRKLQIAMIFLIAMSAPLAASEFDQNAETPAPKASAWRMAMSEVAIVRCRTALKLTAAQEKYWPAVARALRSLAHMQQVDEKAVRRVAPAMSTLFARLDDSQKQVAIGLVHKAGLSQYASLF